MPLHLPPELERRIAALAAQTHREPDTVLADLVGAALKEDEAFRSEVRAGLTELDRGEGIDHDEAKRPPCPTTGTTTCASASSRAARRSPVANARRRRPPN
jgi:predicted transcriptional regulator